MSKFRKKQKRIKHITHSVSIVTALYMLFFIGAETYIRNTFGSSVIFNYIAQVLIVVSLILLLVYYSTYGKCERYLEKKENEIADAGYYLTARTETTSEQYFRAVCDDLSACGYQVNYGAEINELEFDAVAYRSKSFMYLLQTDTADQNDVTAYLDSAVYDAMAVRLKRKGSGVLVLICDQADDSAVAVSKTVFEYGRKAKLKFAVAIAELSTGRVYFLGNEPTKCQQMIANFVMNCDLPIKEKYIVKTKLPFQTELQEKLDHFTYRDFKEGNFLSE